MTKNMIFGSMAAAGIVALLAILDLALKFPFAGYSLTFDILMLVASLIVLYLGWDSYRDNR
jgi:threonine/homoserine/homoserine lactone efflux protein